MKEKTQYRISTVGMVALIGAAILADLFSLIPLVGDITGPVFWACASIYLWRVGCGFFNSKQLATKAISFIGEMIPAVQELPLTLAGIIVVIILVRAEDKTGISMNSLKGKGGKPGINSGGVRTPTQVTEPLYKDGIRAPKGGLK